MARVTASEVKAIMDGCATADATVEIMIGAASELLDVVFAGDSVLSTSQLKEIERWLTAHMLSITMHRQTKEEKVGDASASFTGKWGEKLLSTSYGQMVLILDITGKLSKAGKQAASIYAVKSFEE